MEESKYEEGKYFVCGEKEKQRWKRRKISGEGKYTFLGEELNEKDKEEYIWKGKVSICRRKETSQEF